MLMYKCLYWNCTVAFIYATPERHKRKQQHYRTWNKLNILETQKSTHWSLLYLLNLLSIIIIPFNQHTFQTDIFVRGRSTVPGFNLRCGRWLPICTQHRGYQFEEKNHNFNKPFFSVIGKDHLATYLTFINLSMSSQTLVRVWKSCFGSGMFCVHIYIFLSNASVMGVLLSILYCCFVDIVILKVYEAVQRLTIVSLWAVQWYIVNTARINNCLLSILAKGGTILNLQL